MAGVVAHTEHRTSSVALPALFDTVVAEDVLPQVLHRHLMVPAVVGTRDLTGPWDVAGSERTVLLGNGTSVRERVERWERPTTFAYAVDRFPAPLSRLAARAEGHWTFDGDDSCSAFTWTYGFIPRNALARVPLQAFVAGLWAGYMSACADRCVQLAERRI